MGIAQKVFYVTVTEVPEIRSKFVNLTLSSQDKVNITCESSGLPAPKIMWKFENQVIQESETIQFDSSFDTGDYQCFSVNDEGVDRKFIHIEILKEPQLIEEISEIEMVQEVKEGDDLELVCPYENFLEIFWSANQNFLNSEESSNILKIPNINSTYNGNISCFVTNLAGNKSFSYQVDVLHAPKINSNLEESNGIYDFLNDEFNVEDLNYIVGETLILNCSATGNPKPEVSWKKSGDTIALGEVLEIENLNLHHQDIYTCLAENELGIHKKSFKVDVLSPPVILNKKIQKFFQLSFGENVSLKCKMMGNPPVTLFWFKDG